MLRSEHSMLQSAQCSDMRHFIILFYCYADYRDLHSFPTRRSSDLRSSRISRATGGGWARPTSSSRCRPGSTSRRAARSEEHTSELQSRRDLVCRLLLEKKKKTKCWLPRSQNRHYHT